MNKNLINFFIVSLFCITFQTFSEDNLVSTRATPCVNNCSQDCAVAGNFTVTTGGGPVTAQNGSFIVVHTSTVGQYDITFAKPFCKNIGVTVSTNDQADIIALTNVDGNGFRVSGITTGTLVNFIAVPVV